MSSGLFSKIHKPNQDYISVSDNPDTLFNWNNTNRHSPENPFAYSLNNAEKKLSFDNIKIEDNQTVQELVDFKGNREQGSIFKNSNSVNNLFTQSDFLNKDSPKQSNVIVNDNLIIKELVKHDKAIVGFSGLCLQRNSNLVSQKFEQ